MWYQQHPNKKNIRRYHYVMTKNNTGVLGIECEEVDHVMPKSDDDWKTSKEDSDGLTKTGQKLFQLAVESYVYSVLGAQAQTRWLIVGQGAKSLQTQDIFHKLVKDTITQDDPVKAISDMRLAIENTNVVLNLAISPGMILIPSDMTILKKKVAGYNNTLTLATKKMKFEVNEEVNKVTLASGGNPGESQGSGKTTSTPTTQGMGDLATPSIIPEADGTAYLLGHRGHPRFRGSSVRDLSGKIS